MSIIVGLGNIGSEYDNTRHNIGFDIVDSIAETLSITFGPGGGPFVVAEGRYKGRKVVLAKPTTFMNRSGTAVKKLLAKYNTDKKDCLVVYDDLNLAVGTNRMKARGSAGGHNGIKDIIERLGSDDFPRLRFGIGDDFKRGRQVDFVLSPFDEDEIDEVKKAIKHAHDAALSFATVGIERTMNYFN
ncbi:aminoacyl-tRNA hydrolase [Balneola vulgaris]|jgi:PTH1 family peptidyl-tRNA hydrolase|uniref:aminoacyl-tRNA hydrolase n=1 Tax=Balneola vulgaris TaxID=287535 RepID=UPI000369CBBE|nr:aminoacyl-tRNA hydrolase [Balneola vulgaris]